MLINPCLEYESSYRAYIAELGDEERYPYPLDLEFSDFKALVSTLDKYSQGLLLPPHLVPNTTYWLIEDNEIVGCSHLRHKLNASLRIAGGHIGIGIRPRFRGCGFGKQLLLLTLQQAKAKGIEDIHIHCYADNKASKNLIESVGARLDSTTTVDAGSKQVLRYIFDRLSQSQ